MLPESKEGRSLYIETRDYRNRWRQGVLSQSKGDLDALAAHVFVTIEGDCELAHLREGVDFAASEGLLTEGMLTAAKNAIDWASQLRAMIQQGRAA